MRNTIYFLIGSFVLLTSFTYHSRQYQARLRADAELSRNLENSDDLLRRSSKYPLYELDKVFKKQIKSRPFHSLAQKIDSVAEKGHTSMMQIEQYFAYDAEKCTSRYDRTLDCAALLRLHDSLNRRFIAFGTDSLLVAEKIKVPFDAVYERHFQSGIAVLPYKSVREQFAWLHLELGYWQSISNILIADLAAHAQGTVEPTEYAVALAHLQKKPYYRLGEKVEADIGFVQILAHPENIKMSCNGSTKQVDKNSMAYFKFPTQKVGTFTEIVTGVYTNPATLQSSTVRAEFTYSVLPKPNERADEK